MNNSDDEAGQITLDGETTAALMALTIRYATALDGKDWPLLRSCFTANALVDYHLPGGTLLQGSDQVVEFNRNTITPMSATLHCMSNQQFRSEESGVVGTCYVIAQHVRRNLPGGEKCLIGAIYRDRYEREIDGWRISFRDAQAIWVSGNWRVILGPDADISAHRPL